MRHLLAVFALPLVFALLALYRWEWLIVALMTVFLLYPLLLSFVYFYYALKPEMRTLIGPLELGFNKEEIRLQFYKKVERRPEDDDKDPRFIPAQTEKLSYDDIKKVYVGEKKTVIYLRTPKYASITLTDKDWPDEKCGKKLPKEIVRDFFIENGTIFV